MSRKIKEYYLIIIAVGILLTTRYQAYEKVSLVTQPESLHAILPEYSGASYCGDFPCIGNSACKALRQRLVKIFDVNSFRKDGNWTVFEGIIYDAQFRGGKPGVVHILGDTERPAANHVDSLVEWNRTLCGIIGERRNCNPLSKMKNIAALRQVSRVKGYLKPTMVRKLSLSLECASQRLVNRIVRRSGSPQYGYESLRKLRKELKKSLIFKLITAPRLWFREAFPSNERWPFGNGMGACGRIIVNRGEYGVPLDELYEEPWRSRVDLSVQILEIVSLLTDNEDGYFFELQDITSSHFVRYSFGKLYIDVYDGIRVKDQTERMQREGLPRSCVTFNKAANFRAACRILAGDEGLLHDVDESQPVKIDLEHLLNQCLQYNITMPSEKNGFDDLLTFLSDLRPCNEAFAYRYPECQYIGGR